MTRKYRRTCSLLLRASTLLVSFSSGYGRAFAGSCSYAAGVFTCSGAADSGTDTTQSINIALPLTVVTLPGFGIDTSTRLPPGNAFTLQTTGGFLSFTDVNHSAITGALTGITATNLGIGALTITSNGTVIGIGDHGIYATNAAPGTDLTINAAVVTGATRGIFANNLGSGALSITATGPVTGTTSHGIFANNLSAGTDLTITAAGVTGALTGITARNEGSGALSITSTGMITGTSGSGIYAMNFTAGTDLTISALDVTGGSYGINALNRGTGALSISSTGTVTGYGGHGIFANNLSTATALTIAAAYVTGVGARGIYAVNYGSGALTITATGTVVGTGGEGIFATNYSTGTDLTITAARVKGSTSGIDATNLGSGALSITATAEVNGYGGYGIKAKNYLAATDLTITVADVTSTNEGISARNYGSGALSITSGTVTSASTGIFALNRSNGTDLAITTANVLSLAGGIDAQNEGSGALSITATGPVTGLNGNGIAAVNSSNGTDLTITSANVTGTLAGINVINDGSGALSITSTGAVIATNGYGIIAYNSPTGTNLTITAADVSGTAGGIYAQNLGSGALSVTTTGTVTGTSGDGISVNNTGVGATTITVGALSIVEGGDTGIEVKSTPGQPATINVYGQVGNLSGLNTDDAILSTSGPTTVNLFAGSTVTGHISLSDYSGDTVNLYGTLDGSLSLNEGNDTFYQVGGSILTGIADGGPDFDTLGFNNMGTVDGSKYINFESLGIYGGSTTLINAWDFATGTVTIYEGNLNVDGSLTTSLLTVEDGGSLVDNGTITSTTLDIQSGGAADINGVATIAGSTTVGGTLDVNAGGQLTSDTLTVNSGGSLDDKGTITIGTLVVQSGGVADIDGTATITGSTTVGGTLDVNAGGQLTTGSLTVNSGGVASIQGTANVQGTTDIFGNLNVDGTLTTSLLTVEPGASLIDNGAITGTALDIQPGGVASINGTATISGATTVGGLLGIPAGGLLTTGSLTVNSGGTANIQGAAVVNGAADIFGSLYLEGSLATSQLTVEPSGLLSGNGSVSGAVSIYGTVSPGPSIATLHVNGSLSFMPGSTYMVELDDSGNSDLIQVNGSASISGGTITTSLPIALYSNGQSWHIIEASGGVDGFFSTLENNSGFTSYTVDLEQQINGDNLDLVIVRTPFASFATTPNEAAIGQALDDLVPSAEGSMADLIITMDFAMDPSQLTATLGGMNPEMYAAFPAASLEVAGNFTRMVAMRQEEAWPEEGDPLWEVWGQVFGHRLDRDGDNEISGYTLDTIGTVIGMDRSFATAARAGLMLGYSSSDLAWSDSNSGGGIDGKHIEAYGSARLAGFRIDGTAGYTDLGNSAGRILTTPAFTGTASADFNSSVWGASLVGTYDFTFAQLTFGPVVSLDYLHLDQQGFSEQGLEDFATQIQSTDADSLISSLGVQLSGVLEKDGWRFLPRTEVALVHQFEENGTDLTATFIDYPDATFTVEGAEPENNWLLASLGVSVEFQNNLSLDLDFSTSWADDQNAKLLAGKLIWAF